MTGEECTGRSYDDGGERRWKSTFPDKAAAEASVDRYAGMGTKMDSGMGGGSSAVREPDADAFTGNELRADDRTTRNQLAAEQAPEQSHPNHRGRKRSNVPRVAQ